MSSYELQSALMLMVESSLEQYMLVVETVHNTCISVL
jgi:hypothetical protein